MDVSTISGESEMHSYTATHIRTNMRLNTRTYAYMRDLMQEGDVDVSIISGQAEMPPPYTSEPGSRGSSPAPLSARYTTLKATQGQI